MTADDCPVPPPKEKSTSQPQQWKYDGSGASAQSSWLMSFLPALSCAFMLYSSATAIWDSHGDPSTVVFVVSSISILGLLYLSMRRFERAVVEKDTVTRDRLKMSIWALAMLLNFVFSYRVTAVLQNSIMTGVVWGIAALTSLVGVYLLFFMPQRTTEDQQSQKPLVAGVGKNSACQESESCVVVVNCGTY